MSNDLIALAEAERAGVVATLADIRGRLDRAGEMLAALHIAHALECLDPEHPLNREQARQGS